jgi:hypothetical protein
VLILECEDRGLDFGRLNGRMNNDQDQRRIDPNDAFFANVGTAGRVQTKWGRA